MSESSVTEIALGQISNTCFVVMPFDSLFQTEYERVIRPAVESAGLECIRGDEIYSKPNIVSDIWKEIRAARVIVAELTGRNANVFYEIGLAHALGKPVILLTRHENDVPFDLRSLRYRYYDPNDPYWGENLQQSLTEMLNNILSQTTYESHLDGIATNVRQPLPPVSPFVREESTAYNLSGVWSGNWTPKSLTISKEHEVLHEGQMLLKQHKERLEGTLTVTYKMRDDFTVVQQDLIGSIADSTVNLRGVSYTFIRRGNAPGFNLDSFALEVVDNGTCLKGAQKGEKEGVVECVGNAIFKRMESQTA